MKTLKEEMDSLPTKGFEGIMVSNCYSIEYNENGEFHSKVPLQTVYDKIYRMAVEGGLEVRFENREGVKVITLNKIYDDNPPKSLHEKADKRHNWSPNKVGFGKMKEALLEAIEESKKTGPGGVSRTEEQLFKKTTPADIMKNFDDTGQFLPNEFVTTSTGDALGGYKGFVDFCQRTGKIEMEALIENAKMPEAILENRKGYIRLEEGFLKKEGIHILRALFSNFFPHWIKEQGGMWGYPNKFYGVSEYFDPVEKGTVVPEYKATFFTPARGPSHISFEKVKIGKGK
tara:strand:+ start:5790 stop:6650 length:861 start_codon:yes stop_codon:yes gene_type:complete